MDSRERAEAQGFYIMKKYHGSFTSYRVVQSKFSGRWLVFVR